MKTISALLILALAFAPLTSSLVAPLVHSFSHHQIMATSSASTLNSPTVSNDSGGWVPCPPLPPPPPQHP